MSASPDFEFPEGGRIVLTEEGFKKICTEYEQWMNGKNSMSAENSFRGKIKEQTSKLKIAIKNHTEYQPYSWRFRHVSR